MARYPFKKNFFSKKNALTGVALLKLLLLKRVKELKR
jgi:hypothetical protein